MEPAHDAARDTLGPARGQRGLSLVELLVGLAIGLFIVAGGLSLFATQSRATLDTTMDVQLKRNLRQAMEFMTQDLRRAGAWENAIAGAPSSPSGYVANPHLLLNVSGNEVSYSYGQDRSRSRNAGLNTLNADEQFGLRLRNGVLESAQGNGLWQALTDARTVEVTALTVTPKVLSTSASDVCTKPCCDTLSAACPAVNAPSGCPKVQRWSFDLALEGRARRDQSLTARLQGQVQVRNEFLVGRCPA